MATHLHKKKEKMCRHLTQDQLDQCHVWGNRISMELAGNNKEAAQAVMEMAFLQLRSASCKVDLMSTPLAVMVPTRLSNALEGMQVKTVSDLLHSTLEVLMTIPGFKETSIIEVLFGVLNFVINHYVDREHELGQARQ